MVHAVAVADEDLLVAVAAVHLAVLAFPVADAAESLLLWLQLRPEWCRENKMSMLLAEDNN